MTKCEAKTFHRATLLSFSIIFNSTVCVKGKLITSKFQLNHPTANFCQQSSQGAQWSKTKIQSKLKSSQN